MGKRFIPEHQYAKRWQREADIAKEVNDRMSGGGRPEGHLTRFDFHFVSNQEDKLVKLQEFLTVRYPYKLEPVKKYRWRRWCLDGQTNEFRYTEDNLLYWVFDMFDRGFDHDAELDGYGSLFDPTDIRFLDVEIKDQDHYFDIGMKAYDSGNPAELS